MCNCFWSLHAKAITSCILYMLHIWTVRSSSTSPLWVRINSGNHLAAVDFRRTSLSKNLCVRRKRLTQILDRLFQAPINFFPFDYPSLIFARYTPAHIFRFFFKAFWPLAYFDIAHSPVLFSSAYHTHLTCFPKSLLFSSDVKDILLHLFLESSLHFCFPFCPLYSTNRFGGWPFTTLLRVPHWWKVSGISLLRFVNLLIPQKQQQTFLLNAVYKCGGVSLVISYQIVDCR